MKQCSLCHAPVHLFKTYKKVAYYHCHTCDAIQLDPEFYLSASEEKGRYLLHHNDPEHLGYRQFVASLLQEILANQTTDQVGLDYGSGTEPVISILLKEHQYEVKNYDPYFNPDKSRLTNQYDYIICCEVMEHFYTPATEFERLYFLLKPGGTLYCKTLLWKPETDFDSWWYKNDPTHVFFYSENTLQWIQKQWSFKNLQLVNEVILLRK